MRRELWNIANGKPRNDKQAKRSLTIGLVKTSETPSMNGNGSASSGLSGRRSFSRMVIRK